METLLDILEEGSETAIQWFKQNEVIVNPNKFQVMVLGRHKQKETIWKLMEKKWRVRIQ